MIELTDLDARVYLLPDDGREAEDRFLALLHDPGETFIFAYGFTLQPMFDEIIAADQAGVAIHILLDHTQATGHAEAPKVRALAAALHHGDVTITTAGPRSGAPSQILHSKCMIVRATDGGEDWVWTGSVNFSASGWLQGNTAFLVRSNALAQALIDQFIPHRAWARAEQPQYQMPAAA